MTAATVQTSRRPVRRPMSTLRQARLDRGWTLEDVTRELDTLATDLGMPALGVTPGMVGDWERGKHTPRAPYPRLLVKLYDQPASTLGLLPAVADTAPPAATVPEAATVRAVVAAACVACPSCGGEVKLALVDTTTAPPSRGWGR